MKQMKTYIALFRGINVGGNNMLRMNDLKAILADLGAQNVKTYIQSGNVFLQHAAEQPVQLTADIQTAVATAHGFTPQVLLLTYAQLEQAIAANPFPQGDADPKSVHLYFLVKTPANPDLATLSTVKKDSEQFRLIDSVFYLYAPDGIGRSQLAARVEKALGVAATARNWRTVGKLMALAPA